MYALVLNNIVLEIISNAFEVNEPLQLIEISNNEVNIGWLYNEDTKIFYQKPLTIEEIIKSTIIEYEKKVQDRLDNFAKTKTYDNILSACTYANDDVPEFKIEGQYCTKMRSITWKAAQTFLNESIADVMAGLRDIPTWEEVESNLPVLEWPEGSRN